MQNDDMKNVANANPTDGTSEDDLKEIENGLKEIDTLIISKAKDEFTLLTKKLQPLCALYDKTNQRHPSHDAIYNLEVYLGGVYREQILTKQLKNIQPVYEEVLKRLEDIEEKAQETTNNRVRSNSKVVKTLFNTYSLFAQTGEEKIAQQANELHREIYYLRHPTQPGSVINSMRVNRDKLY